MVIVLGFYDYENKVEVEDFKGWFHGFFTEGSQEESLDTVAIIENIEDGRILKVFKLQNIKFVNSK